MFSDAIETAMTFTRPLMRVRRHYDGSVEFPLSSAVILNEDGWFVSAAHAWAGLDQAMADGEAVRDFETRRAQIEQADMGTKKAAHKAAKLKANPQWVTHDLTLCLYPEIGREFPATDVRVYPALDIAIGRLENFDPSLVDEYPRLASRDDQLRVGTQICKLGFPFPSIGGAGADLDENGGLAIHFENLQLPYFPLDGMFTRIKIINVVEKDEEENETTHEARFLESSTPGLPGQSGGPWIDEEGTVWAIQSHTTTIDLNMGGQHQEGKQTLMVPQFLNLGHGLAIQQVLDCLDERDIEYQTA